MAHAAQYTEQILQELQALPAEALPEVLRLLRLVREEFLKRGTQSVLQEAHAPKNHTKTHQLLASSPSNWAQNIIAEREDRL